MQQKWCFNKKFLVFIFILCVSMTIGAAYGLLLVFMNGDTSAIAIVEGVALSFLAVLVLFATVYVWKLLMFEGCYASLDGDGFFVFPFGYICWSEVELAEMTLPRIGMGPADFLMNFFVIRLKNPKKVVARLCFWERILSKISRLLNRLVFGGDILVGALGGAEKKEIVEAFKDYWKKVCRKNSV